MLLSVLLTKEALAFRSCGQTSLWVLFADVDRLCPRCLLSCLCNWPSSVGAVEQGSGSC